MMHRLAAYMKERAVPFEDRYIPEPNSGCFIWLGSVDKDGYGHCRGLYSRRAHREAYYRAFGDPSGSMVLHKCDNPSCVNPDHLFLGDAQANADDAREKNRTFRPRGERNGASRLSEAQIKKIRSDNRAQEVIATEYGITQSNVSLIKSGRNWRHVS